MYTHKCWACDGSGVTMFRQNGGRCYTCGGAGEVTPMDVDREMDRMGRTALLKTGRLVGDLLLAEDGNGGLEWTSAHFARQTGSKVLVPDDSGLQWEVAELAELPGPVMEAPF